MRMGGSDVRFYVIGLTLDALRAIARSNWRSFGMRSAMTSARSTLRRPAGRVSNRSARFVITTS
jgi:hypothetical protein